MERRIKTDRNNAFTLVELLVIISIIAMLMALLMPVLAKAREQGRAVFCLNNLRQMAIAADTYALSNDEYYPLARFDDRVTYICYEWDFIKVQSGGAIVDVKPGLLWQGSSILKVQQCPTYKGPANSIGDSYTGYNYNVSYIGGIITKKANGELQGLNSIKRTLVKRPSACAIFGDGQYGDGANKFMRSPFTGILDENEAWARPYGTQGFRHSRKTNVVFCDGSATKLSKRYTETYPPLKRFVAEQTGFLSPDNSAYDLE
ncbi:MAG: type II secretion system protein [Planctomycetota bacterium]|jgi:prepilin-type processing-associated H-X9-DG protein